MLRSSHEGLLFTLLTHDCTPSHNSNLFIKFADDTTVVGLISNRDETNYRSEVSRLAGWCRDNNLSLNVEKTKEIVVDFRRVHSLHAPLTINGATVERVSSTKLDLSWTNNTAALAKKAQQRLYFLRKLRRARAPAPIMCTFYRGTIESILTSCITVWYGTCNVSCRKSHQRIVRAAEKIVGVSLPSLKDIYNTSLTRKRPLIAGDPTHPTPSFFSVLLPSGETAESPGEDRILKAASSTGCQEVNSLPSFAPPHSGQLYHSACHPPPPPPPPTHTTNTHHTNTHKHTIHTHHHGDQPPRHFVQHWTDLIQLPLLDQSKKDCLFVTLNRIDLISSFAVHNLYSALFVCLFISLVCTLPCALCHFIHFLYYYFYLFIFLHVLICIFVIVAFLCAYMCMCICIYIWFVLICIFAFYC